MKVVGVVFADFVTAPFGGPSQLQTPLGGRPILLRTLRRVLQTPGLDARCLFVRPRDADAAAEFLKRAALREAFELVAEDPGARRRGELIRIARKWSLDSWRSNPLGLTWYDEYVCAHIAGLVMDRYQCQALLCIEGHQPLLDSGIAGEMVALQRSQPFDCNFVFSQAPPGLSGLVLHYEGVKDLLEMDVPFGLLLSYRPEMPSGDLTNRTPCHQLPPEISHRAGRFTGDTRRSREVLEAALAELGDEPSALELCRWAARPERGRAGALPVEVELELTTEDPLPNTTLRPRGDRVPRRPPADILAVERLARELAACDDRLVWLAGHGDPLRHPQFPDVCRALREGGVYGIGVATPLVDLSDAQLEALFTVDVVEIQLDADTSATYARVHRTGESGATSEGNGESPSLFERVVRNIRRLEQVRRERGSPWPVLVVSQTRCAATLPELETFHDRWIAEVGSAVIHGYNDYCGRVPADTLLPTWPAVREPCRRLWTRMTLLADGTAALCQQDLRGDVKLGDWTDETVGELWNSERIRTTRAAHEAGALESLPLCANCHEWFRP